MLKIKSLAAAAACLLFLWPHWNIVNAQVDRDKKYTESRNAAVATAHPEASRIALEVLQNGGNAIDAAIAAAYALGVVEPTASGIGGGGNALVYIKSEDKVYNLDFYPRSPANPFMDYQPSRDNSTVRAVSVPGFVAGMEELRERWAKLDREAHIRPSIHIAREGFVPDSVLLGRIRITTDKVNEYEESRALFTDNGNPISSDFVIRNPKLAEVMEQIIEEGRSGFYNSELTQRLIDGMNELGGRFTLDDFRNFETSWREPVKGSYRGYDVFSAAPPVSGTLIVQSLQMMEYFDFEQYGHFTESTESMHFLIEMFKRSFADRLTYLGDPDFVDVPVEGLASKSYARNRFSDINMGAATPRVLRDTEPGNPYNFMAGRQAERFDIDGISYMLIWTDDMEDDQSSFDWWGDDRFDSWGAQRDLSAHERRQGFLQSVFDTGRADTVRVSIEDDDDWVIDEEGEPENETNTTHITVIDKDGNMVSMTSTVGLLFGSGVTVNGVVMNSGQGNFGSTNPVNLMQPNRIPRSMIAPTLLLRDREPFMAIGAAGGGRIPAAIVLGIHNVIDFGMDAFEAVSAPRFISRRWADNVEFEALIPENITNAMRRMGHPVSVRRPMEVYFGGMQIIIVRPDGTIEAAADPRRDGGPAGY